MIALVQKDTGLPLFYEIVSGNIVDISTIENIIRLAKQYHCDVSYAIGDAGYCCPSTIEKLVLAGIDFMTRLNPTYETFTEVVKEHRHELDNEGNTVRYRDRLVRVVKIPSQIAVKKENGEARKVFFGRKPGISDEKILNKRSKQAVQKAQTAASTAGLVVIEPPVKRKPGRPKGSKNKKTLLREAAEAAAKANETKRGRGRPKGSKDKKPRQKRGAK